MSERPHEPELLESLLSPDDGASRPGAETQAQPAEYEDLDTLIDELETLLGEAKRVPFGRKLMVDEAHALEVVDRLRASVPAAVRQAHRIVEEQERIVGEAQEQARRILHERGLMAELDIERERVIARAERDADRIRADADAYVRSVLNDLAERLEKFQASVQNGLETLQGPQAN